MLLCQNGQRYLSLFPAFNIYTLCITFMLMLKIFFLGLTIDMLQLFCFVFTFYFDKHSSFFTIVTSDL